MVGKIVVCGCSQFGYELISWLLDAGLKITYVVTIDQNIAKKSHVSSYCDFGVLGKKYNIPVYYVQEYSLKNDIDLSFFKTQQFDLLIQGGWQRLFPETILKTLKVGAVGCHGSSEYLPHGRGRSPINWSLIEGKKRFIFHYFLMKPGIDDGDIFHYEEVDINEWDTCQTLYYKNAIVTYRVLSDWIPKLLSNNHYETLPQQGDATYYPKRTAEDGHIKWSTKTVFEIYNFIRALTRPYPGAFTFYNGTKIIIWKAQPFDTRIETFGKKYGEVVYVFQNGDFLVNSLSGLLLVTEYSALHSITQGQMLS